MGYVGASDGLHTFQEKIPIESKQSTVKSILWDRIKLGSPHLNEWHDLFFGDHQHENSEHHTTF